MPGQASSTPQSTRDGKRWPAFPGIPIFLEIRDERKTPNTYGTTPTTPTKPEVFTHNPSAPSNPTHLTAPEMNPVPTSPTTTIQTSSNRSSLWPIPVPPPEIQHQESRQPALCFSPTQRPHIRLDGIPTLEIPQMDEKTPINASGPGLGIVNGPPKPPTIQISSSVSATSQYPPENIAQRIEQTLWRYTRSGNILKRWLLEILSWLLSAACMFAIIAVLVILKDERLTKWSLAEKTGLTLNAYISVLSKIAGAALILPVSEALGQLKWSWFLGHSKQMWDYEIFDNASRGPWGALLLLVRTKGRSLAALGAMITLVSLALDPFFQQVVDFPDRWALANITGAIPRVTRYSPFYTPEFMQGMETSFINPALRPVVGQFFIDNGTQPVPFGNGTRPDIPLSCPTNNCTWPEYETLGVCSQCVKVTDMLSYACLFTKIDWSADQTGEISDVSYPNGTVCGYFLNATSSTPVLMSGYIADDNSTQGSVGEALLVRTLPLTDMLTKTPVFGGSVNFKHIVNPILDALIVSAVDGAESLLRKEIPIAHECVLAWCVQTMQSTYSSGVYSENITSIFLNTSTKKQTFPWESFPVEINGEVMGNVVLYTQNLTIQPPSLRNHSRIIRSSGMFESDNTTVSNVLQSFDDYFPSYYTIKPSSEKPMLRYKNYLGGPALRRLAFNPLLAPNNITRHMERLATAITNVVRSDDNSKDMLSGEAFNHENYVSVRWEWLALPLGLLLSSLVFLAATIVQSAVEGDRVGVWKTSAIATLLYGLPDDVQRKLTASEEDGTPRAKAKGLRVKLQPNKGWRISDNLFSPFTPKPRLNQPPPGWI
ncbi:hypothetical protein EKO04_001535 [Ascochyta lentis]|uniref:DUF3176 domain containing protein n=1 Tax=Ascochyta lentis TaxID=205686 RepID=A0A8H7JD78_9PLEO|nr:hypothetical protein EKO04_001535 [Ascochyta lentis]